MINNGSIAALAYTAPLNISEFATIYGFYEDGSTTTSVNLNIEFSSDGVNYIQYGSPISAYVPYMDTKRRATIYKMDVAGINYMRLKNTSATETLVNVTCSLFGCSMP